MNKRIRRMPTISEALRKAIQSSRESVTAIAKAAGIPQPRLYRFAEGQQGLTLKNADKLAVYFGLELTRREGHVSE
jgi:plasmid maintenance system antidote protein VapI